MPTTYKVLGQSNPATTANADMITVAAGRQQVISTISIANSTASSANAQVWVRVAGAAASAANILVPVVAVAANSTLALTLGVTVQATDVITVQSSTGSALTFQAFGSEIS